MFVRLTILLFTLVLASAVHARTTVVAPLAPEWMLDRWSVEDGLPIAHVSGVALAADGAVWVATVDGMVRFDGDTFRVLRRANVPELPSNRFTDVVALPDGPVWAFTDSGDVVRVDGRPRVYRAEVELAGRATRMTIIDGVLWLNTTAGLVRLGDSPSAPEPTIVGESFAIAPDGARWHGGLDGVFRTAPGAAPERVMAVPAGVDTLLVLGIVDGAVYIAGRELHVLRGGRIDTLASAEGMLLPCGIVPRPDGAIDVRAWNGLFRIATDGHTMTRVVGGVSDCRPNLSSGSRWPWRFGAGRLFHEDRLVLEAAAPITMVLPSSDGGAWIATVGDGLMRLRPRHVQVVPAPDAWPRKSVDTLMVDGRDVLWLGSQNHGLWRSEPAGVVPIHVERADEGHKAVFGIVDDGGVIEVGSTRRCRVAPGGPCEPAPEPWRRRPTELIAPLLRDSQGRIWADVRDETMRDGRLIVQRGLEWKDVLSSDGRPMLGGHAVEAADGDVLVTTLGHGLLQIRDGVVRRLGLGDGLSSERLRGITIDARGVVWIGTEDAGLCRWRRDAGERIGCVGVAEGLLDDIVHAIELDDRGRLWLSGNRGLSWVLRDAVEAVIEGRAEHVLAVGLDERDGMKNREANGILPQSSAHDSRGRLFFPTQDGAVFVDPRAVPLLAPPAVEITGMTVGDRVVDRASGTLELDSEERSLTVTWTAPAIDGSRDVRFRHRLVGLDDAWSAPSTERRAQWLSLPPGELTLEIEAGLGGTWSAPRRLVVRRAPTFVESTWFNVAIGAGVLALAALGWFAWSLRQRRARVRLERQIALATADLAEANQRLAARSREAAAHAARVIELDKTRTRFVADLSHELRTPLGLVMGPLEDLAERFAGAMDDGDRRRLTVIRENVARLEELNDQLLDVARLEAHEVPLRARLADLGAFVCAAAERFRPTAEKRGLALEVHAPGEPLPLYFDPDLIDKVLSNLIGNALKFTERGHVRVRVEPGDESARVVVEDSGVGIPADALPRLFERFYQVDRGDARRFEGVGIGLALVRELVTLHGGEIAVASAPGAGSTFTVTLPRGADHLGLEDIDVRPRLVPAADVPVTATGSGPDVLLVEDHPDMRAYLAEHLAAAFSVRVAAHGEAALAAVAERVPRAIVSDVMMPGMDGLALCRALRADARTAAVPIVLVSAKAGEADRVAGLAVADDYLTKPVRPRELVARVSRLLARPDESTSEDVRDGEGTGEGERAGEGESGARAVAALGPVDRRHLERIAAIVMEHLSDSAFGVNELAAALAQSPRQLQREVRRLTGHSPVQYLRAVRMDAARARLRAGVRDTVAEVAADVGMSPAYFSRVYTTWFGVAPSEDVRRV